MSQFAQRKELILMKTTPQAEAPAPMEYFIVKAYSYVLQRNLKLKLAVTPAPDPTLTLIKAENTARESLSTLYGLIGNITVVRSEIQA